MDGLGPAHPRFGADTANPIGEARNESEILDDVLFADQPDRDDTAGRDRDRRTEERSSMKMPSA